MKAECWSVYKRKSFVPELGFPSIHPPPLDLFPAYRASLNTTQSEAKTTHVNLNDRTACETGPRKQNTNRASSMAETGQRCRIGGAGAHLLYLGPVLLRLLVVDVLREHKHRDDYQASRVISATERERSAEPSRCCRSGRCSPGLSPCRGGCTIRWTPSRWPRGCAAAARRGSAACTPRSTGLHPPCDVLRSRSSGVGGSDF